MQLLIVVLTKNIHIFELKKGRDCVSVHSIYLIKKETFQLHIFECLGSKQPGKYAVYEFSFNFRRHIKENVLWVYI